MTVAMKIKGTYPGVTAPLASINVSRDDDTVYIRAKSERNDDVTVELTIEQAIALSSAIEQAAG